MTLIDTHSHIYSVDFDADFEAMIERADKAGVMQILMPAIDASTHEKMMRIEEQFPQKCISMIGLHPCSVLGNYVAELAIIEEYLDKKKFIAIGETGLDFFWDLTYKDQQYDSFQKQIEWALKSDIPIVIHSRNSTDECIEMIAKNQDGHLKGVFHCFSGTLEQARRIIDLGLYLGIGGVVTFKNSGLDKVINELSLEHIVLETDAPYLAPVPFRGKRNEPSYLNYVVQKLAELKGINADEIAAITTANAQKLFGL